MDGKKSHQGHANLNHSEIHYTSIRMVKTKNPDSNENAKQQNACTLLVGMQNDTAFSEKQFGSFV